MPCGRPSERQATVNGRRISYELHRSPRRRKNVTISIEGDRVRVLAPARTPQQQIAEFVAQRADWIASHLDSARPIGLRSQLGEGGLLPLLGVRYPVEASLAPFQFDGERFRVDVSKPERAAYAEAWLREYARDHFTAQVEHWSPIVGVQPKRLQIRNQKTRWGSASSRGTLSFNWRLIFAPPEIIDYVVVHELCHLIQPDHSPKYWALVESVMPDAQHHRRQLRELGDSLLW